MEESKSGAEEEAVKVILGNAHSLFAWYTANMYLSTVRCSSRLKSLCTGVRSGPKVSNNSTLQTPVD